jgi:hypothetical protein
MVRNIPTLARIWQVRSGAEVAASHSVYVSQPEVVASVIAQAAAAE